MAIVVEDGTGLADAVSYASVAQADAYHTARGNTSWTSAAEADKEAALVRATTALDASYQSRYPGYPTHGRTQALQWPRQGAYSQVPLGNGYPAPLATNEIPREIVYALSEAALQELTEPGAMAPIVAPDNYVTSESVAGAVSVTYAAGRPTTSYFAVVENALVSLLLPANTYAGRMVRF